MKLYKYLMKLSRSEAAVLNWGDFDPLETFDKGQTPCFVVETRELLLAILEVKTRAVAKHLTIHSTTPHSKE